MREVQSLPLDDAPLFLLLVEKPSSFYPCLIGVSYRKQFCESERTGVHR
jgi:hypothetical protein